jgi:hypothetical protein
VGTRVVATSARLLWQVLIEAYSRFGLDVLRDEPFRAMVLARTVELTSKADSLRVLAEVGAPSPGLGTLLRRYAGAPRRSTGLPSPRYAPGSRPVPGRLGGLVLYDVTHCFLSSATRTTCRKWL